MAKRKPLVRINGEIRQLPDGDTVTGCIGGEGSGDSTLSALFVDDDMYLKLAYNTDWDLEDGSLKMGIIL